MLTIRNIVEKLQDDFDLRGVAAQVVFGNWQTSQHTGANRVIIGLSDFDADAQGQTMGMRPGPVVNGSTAAASIALHMQDAVVWVHGIAPEGTPDDQRVNAAHDATVRLLHATIAGLKRNIRQGSIGKGTWPAVDIGDVTYGALARFKFTVAVPVLGDAWAVVPKPYTVTAQVQLNTANGPVVGATVPAEGPE